MSEFEREYKGHTIKLGYDFEFSADSVGRFPTMKQIEVAIDEIERKVYAKTPALLFEQYGMKSGSVIEVVATRPHERNSVWIQVGGKRKASSSVYADTPENRAIMQDITAHWAAIKAANKSVAGLMERLTRVELREVEK